MASLNKAILIGNLTADPELKTTQSGVSVATFTIAVQRRFAKDGQQTADFINIVAWRQTAEFVCKYFEKGKPILICGSIQTRTWTDNSNQKRYATEVVADEAGFVESAGGNTSADAQNHNAQANGAPSFNNAGAAKFEDVGDDDNLPF